MESVSQFLRDVVDAPLTDEDRARIELAKSIPRPSRPPRPRRTFAGPIPPELLKLAKEVIAKTKK
jgi:hypothetical protein